jgi:tetratricopeptide (TPR) repeat protein
VWWRPASGGWQRLPSRISWQARMVTNGGATALERTPGSFSSGKPAGVAVAKAQMGYDLSATSCWRFLETDTELQQIRARWSAAPLLKRREAADHVYHAGIADDLFAAAVREWTRPPIGDSVIMALAIDPHFAPALLTAGSIEYQYGRHRDAMEAFLHLTQLPPETGDLIEIIDKAGSFLLDMSDSDSARELYSAAFTAFSDVPVFASALGYCAGKLGDKSAAVTFARKAAALDPENAVALSDLGWALVEAGEYVEADAILRKAVALAPGITMAEENLRELQRRMSLSSH